MTMSNETLELGVWIFLVDNSQRVLYILNNILFVILQSHASTIRICGVISRNLHVHYLQFMNNTFIKNWNKTPLRVVINAYLYYSLNSNRASAILFRVPFIIVRNIRDHSSAAALCKFVRPCFRQKLFHQSTHSRWSNGHPLLARTDA